MYIRDDITSHTCLVAASDRFLRVNNRFCTIRVDLCPRCIANTCIPPACTISGLLLGHTERAFNRRLTVQSSFSYVYIRITLTNRAGPLLARIISYSGGKGVIDKERKGKKGRCVHVHFMSTFEFFGKKKNLSRE